MHLYIKCIWCLIHVTSKYFRVVTLINSARHLPNRCRWLFLCVGRIKPVNKIRLYEKVTFAQKYNGNIHLDVSSIFNATYFRKTLMCQVCR